MGSSKRDVQELAHSVFSANGNFIHAGNMLVADLGITSAHWQVLAALHYAGEDLPTASIARNMGLTRQGVQRVVDLLADQGLLDFKDNPNHRKAKLVALTAKGRKTVLSAEQAVAPLNRAIIKTIGLRRLREANQTLTELTAIISAHFQGEDLGSPISNQQERESL